MPELTIITINKNNLQGLEKTIHSVFQQTFGNYEYIIIDGASTDGSVDLLKENEIRFTYWVSEPDSGVYQAMNKGICRSTGNYLLFLNSGDYFESKDSLEKVFNRVQNADILTCGYRLVKNGVIVNTTLPPSQITFGYLYLAGINHQSTFIRRELIVNSGLYREDFKYNSDIEFWFRTIILENASVECVPVILTQYNLEGISSKESLKEEFQKELKEIYSHALLEKFIPDYDTWNYERSEMKILYWAKSKKAMYFVIKAIYKLVESVNSFKRKRK